MKAWPGLNGILAGGRAWLWLAGLMLGVPFLSQPLAFAQNSRVVTIHVDEQTVSFPTDAVTVQEALDRVDLTVGQHDLVEPALNTPILSDTFNINVFRARPVLVIDGDKRIETVSAYQSPKLIAEQAGLTVYPEDNFILERITDFVGEASLGLKLTVVRATKLELNLYGTTKTIRSQASTVGELLDQRGLTPAEDDIVRPKPESGIESGMIVSLIRISDDIIVKEESIPFSTRHIVDTSQPVEYQELRSEGVNGTRLVTYRLILENGKEVGRERVSSIVVEQPKEQLLVLGGAPVNLGSVSGAFTDLRGCEAGGVYDRNSGNGFYGAYQFVFGTWQAYAPGGWKNIYPNEAVPAAQDKAALNLYQRSGWGPWPGCTASLGLR